MCKEIQREGEKPQKKTQILYGTRYDNMNIGELNMLLHTGDSAFNFSLAAK